MPESNSAIAIAADQPKEAASVAPKILSESEKIIAAIIEIIESAEFKRRKELGIPVINWNSLSTEEAAIKLAELAVGGEKLLNPKTAKEGREQIIEALVTLPPLTETEAKTAKEKFDPTRTQFYQVISRVYEHYTKLAKEKALAALTQSGAMVTDTSQDKSEMFIFISDVLNIGARPAQNRIKLIQEILKMNDEGLDQAAKDPDQQMELTALKARIAEVRSGLPRRIEKMQEELSLIERMLAEPGDPNQRHWLSYSRRSIKTAIALFETVSKQNISEEHLKHLSEKLQALESPDPNKIANLQTVVSELQTFLGKVESARDVYSRHMADQTRLELALGKLDKESSDFRTKTGELEKSKLRETELVNAANQLLDKKLEPADANLPVDGKFSTMIRAVTDELALKRGEIVPLSEEKEQAPRIITDLRSEKETIEAARQQADIVMANLNAYTYARYGKFAKLIDEIVPAVLNEQHKIINPEMEGYLNTNIPPLVTSDPDSPLYNFYRTLEYVHQNKQKPGKVLSDVQLSGLLRFFGKTEDEAVKELRALIKTGGDYILPRSLPGAKVTFGSEFKELLRSNAQFAAIVKMLILMEKGLVYRDEDGNFRAKKEIDTIYSTANISQAIRELYSPAESLIEQFYSGQCYELHGERSKYAWYNVEANGLITSETNRGKFPRNLFYPLARTRDYFKAWTTTAAPFVLGIGAVVAAPAGIPTLITAGVTFIGATVFTVANYASTASGFTLNKNRAEPGNWFMEKYRELIRLAQTPVIARIPEINPLTDKVADNKGKLAAAGKYIFGSTIGKFVLKSVAVAAVVGTAAASIWGLPALATGFVISLPFFGITKGLGWMRDHVKKGNFWSIVAGLVIAATSITFTLKRTVGDKPKDKPAPLTIEQSGAAIKDIKKRFKNHDTKQSSPGNTDQAVPTPTPHVERVKKLKNTTQNSFREGDQRKGFMDRVQEISVPQGNTHAERLAAQDSDSHKNLMGRTS